MINLRAQLEDIKAINLEMCTKLEECQKSLKVGQIIRSKKAGPPYCLVVSHLF